MGWDGMVRWNGIDDGWDGMGWDGGGGGKRLGTSAGVDVGGMGCRVGGGGNLAHGFQLAVYVGNVGVLPLLPLLQETFEGHLENVLRPDC
jgi:hypothetical protein